MSPTEPTPTVTTPMEATPTEATPTETTRLEMTLVDTTLIEPRWDDARAALAAHVRPLPAVRLPVAACDGLVLAEDLEARIDLPTFDTSAMDGWAVAGAGPWTVSGSSLAGRPWGAALRPGEAVVIATGAVVPAGADAVIRSEDGQVESAGAQVVLRAPAPSGPTHIRPAGEECRSGEVLAGAGSVVTPGLLGLAAASGHDELAVIPRPRVALVLFGDELADSGLPPAGFVRDSLGPQLPAWLARLGAEVVGVERAEDTHEAHVTAIRSAARTAEIVLTTGGTAAGPVDHLHAATAACGGALLVDSVAVRPGHPMLAARLPSQRPPSQRPPSQRPPDRTAQATGPEVVWLVGLPGNPQSAIVTLMSLAAPLLAGLAGRRPVPDLQTVSCGSDIVGPAHEDRLVLGTIEGDTFRAASHLGSGMLRGLAAASGFAVVPPGGAAAGDRVRWLPLPLPMPVSR